MVSGVKGRQLLEEGLGVFEGISLGVPHMGSLGPYGFRGPLLLWEIQVTPPFAYQCLDSVCMLLESLLFPSG